MKLVWGTTNTYIFLFVCQYDFWLILKNMAGLSKKAPAKKFSGSLLGAVLQVLDSLSKRPVVLTKFSAYSFFG